MHLEKRLGIFSVCFKFRKGPVRLPQTRQRDYPPHVDILSSISTGLSEGYHQALDVPFHGEEVRQALFQMGDLKSPGPMPPFTNTIGISWVRKSQNQFLLSSTWVHGVSCVCVCVCVCVCERERERERDF